MHSLLLVTQTLEGRLVPQDRPWRIDVEGFPRKVFGHAASFATLAYDRGTFLPPPFARLAGVEIGFFDFASMAVLVRAALETHLTFFYLFAESSNPDQEGFRHLVWRLDGLRYGRRYGFYTEAGLNAAIERENEHQTVRNNVIAHPWYQTLNQRQQEMARRGEWRMELPGQSFRDVAVAAGFASEYFDAQYAFLSSHAHSGEHALGQLAAVNVREEQVMLMDSLGGSLMVVLGHFIKAFQRAFPDAILPANLQAAVDLQAYMGTPKFESDSMSGDFGPSPNQGGV